MGWEKSKEKKMIALIIFTIIIGILALKAGRGEPIGANLTEGGSSRGSNSSVQSFDAQAGNVTALNIDQQRITDIWQGFFGNVSGQIVLEDASSNNFYDWTIAEMTGEIYATRNQISSWATINCTNSTQFQAEETSLNILSTATDGINETFNSTGHPAFFVGNRQLSGCMATRPYNSSGMPGSFWNILLNSDTANVVYTSLLAEDSNAFDNSTVDFELLVPVNRTTGFATYYFYAEIG